MYQIDFDKPLNVYFVGIGGISMSGLAEILLSRGFTVSGSDRAPSKITKKLEEDGIKVFYGQKEENITPDIDVVIFTAAIHPDNPEYIATKRLGLPSLTRAQLLGEIMRNYKIPVAIAGTHGKTTTTSMISEIMLADNADPTISVGGMLESIGGNVRIGHSDSFIAEACEYTNSFLSLYPKISIILDIDADHLDFFKDLNDIRHSFRKFAQLTPADGSLIINADIPNYEEICGGLDCTVITYGRDDTCDYYPTNIHYDDLGHPIYTLNHRKADGTVSTQEVALHVPGEHNVFNSIAAMAAADLLGADRSVSVKALDAFRGTDRRFQYKGKINGITIIDDYAHHPTEIEATLKAAANLKHNRLFVVFQPHTYTRTKALLPEFAKALTLADVTILADIYAARETDTLGISSQTLQQRIQDLGHGCLYFPSFEEIEDYLTKNCEDGDIVITMGAGDIYKVGDDLLEKAKDSSEKK